MKLELKEFFSYKENRMFFIFILMFLLFYQSIQIFLKKPSWFITFSPEITIWLQKTFSTPTLDVILSWYYPIGFIICLVLLNYLMIKQGRDGWKWGMAIMCCWAIHLALEIILPVAPPLRWESGARPIRLETFPLSDLLVSVKYGGLPSGHFGYIFLGYLIARYKYIKTNIVAYRRYMRFLFANLVLTTFTVFYLGEHTWHDIVASALIFGGIFFIASKYIDYKEHKDTVKTPSPLAS